MKHERTDMDNYVNRFKIYYELLNGYPHHIFAIIFIHTKITIYKHKMLITLTLLF